ncbi:MAG: AbrB/MazE/SpoVT family DNA-binding domain-containing protein [Gammaproteobacteria bacterium]|nr:AbrB/MazE/SpoVT family DNA-binding domain-containing protein [Gammaproteobacteria bacterium]
MHSMKMSEGGRVVIPAEIRAALEIKDGDTVYWELLAGEARLTTKQARIHRAQEIFQRHFPVGGPFQADALIAERRAEAARE